MAPAYVRGFSLSPFLFAFVLLQRFFMLLYQQQVVLIAYIVPEGDGVARNLFCLSSSLVSLSPAKIGSIPICKCPVVLKLTLVC